MSADKTVPSWLDDRDISHAEIVKATDIPQTTIVNWGRIVRASGVEFGKQFRGDWFYSARELYAFSIATALKHLAYPVGLTVMRDILAYVRETDVPERPFTIGFPGCPAVVLVDAKPILAAVIEMMGQVRVLNSGGTTRLETGEAVTFA